MALEISFKKELFLNTSLWSIDANITGTTTPSQSRSDIAQWYYVEGWNTT